MLRSTALVSLIFLSVSPFAVAQSASTDDTDVVRLPGQGELKAPLRTGATPQRFLPAGGLFLSFDTNEDQIITPTEIEIGIETAFTDADSNGDGGLAALEQQAWAASLPTRDDSLANPVSFDPNLDRMVSPEEFHMVIWSLATSYGDPETGKILLEDLTTDLARPEGQERRLANAPERPPRRTNF